MEKLTAHQIVELSTEAVTLVESLNAYVESLHGAINRAVPEGSTDTAYEVKTDDYLVVLPIRAAVEWEAERKARQVANLLEKIYAIRKRARASIQEGTEWWQTNN